LDPPDSGCASQQLCADESIGHLVREEALEASEQFGLLARINGGADDCQNAVVHSFFLGLAGLRERNQYASKVASVTMVATIIECHAETGTSAN
jgi:hypothetical protein